MILHPLVILHPVTGTEFLQDRCQRAPTVCKDRVKVGRGKTQDRTRYVQDTTQAIRYIVRGQLIEQAKHVLRVETRAAVHDGAEVEGVEVADPVVAAKEYGMRGVQIDDLLDQCADIVRVGAAEPSGPPDGDVLRVVEHDFAVHVRVRGAVE